MQRRSRRRKYFPVILILVLIACVFTAVLTVIMTKHRKSREALLADGTAFLQTMDTKSVSSVETIIKGQEDADRENQQEEKRQELLNGKVDVWSLFGDTAILGDSRAVGFYSFGFLPQDRVFADAGNTIADIDSHLDEVKFLNPSTIILCYGLNDVGMSGWANWNSPETYADYYSGELKKLQEAAPNADIYINSILPASETGLASDSAAAQIPQYNAAVKNLVVKSGGTYGWIDCDDLVAENKDLYAEDGLHMQKEFYPKWAAQMMLTIYDGMEASIPKKGASGSSVETENSSSDNFVTSTSS